MTGPRLELGNVAPLLYEAHLRLDEAVRSAVEPALHELIKTRASQLNGCAFCLDMHTRDARRTGESERRLHLLAAWPDAGVFSDRERAALRLTEAITLITAGHVPDDVWAEAARHFSQEELAGIVMAIVTINGWNRIAISSRTPVPLPG